MADNIEIKCINKSDRQNAHERIKSVGGVNQDTTRWKLTLDKAIAGIEAGKWRFFVNVRGASAWVVIAKSATGHKYLKTENDGEQPNNLLSRQSAHKTICPDWIPLLKFEWARP